MTILKRSHLIGYLILLLMGFSEQSKAVVGAELSYQYVNQNEYLLVLLVYRLCSDPAPANSQTLNYNSINCGSSGSITINLDASYEVSGISSDLYPQSSCNGGTHLGMEVFVYTDTLTFPQTCTNWIVDWTGCCRSPSITNLSTVGSPIYVEAGINSTGAYSFYSNYNNWGHYNAYNYYCAGDSISTNHFFKRISSNTGDSLRFDFSCPMQGANNCLSHVAGLSSIQPFATAASGGVQLNHRTGEIDFYTQPGQSQIASMGTTVYQMHQGDTVGYLKYDVPMIILDSLCNRVPEVYDMGFLVGGAYDSLSRSINMCENSVTIFQLSLFDPDGDTVQISNAGTNLVEIFGPNAALFLNGNPPFKHDSAQLSVQILPPTDHICSEPFTIGLTDNGSPFPQYRVLEFNCVINSIEASAGQYIICPYNNSQIQLNTTVVEPNAVAGQGSYQWVQMSGTPVLFSNDTIANPRIIVPASTPSDSIVLQVNYVSAVHPTTNFACPVSTDLLILKYDTTAACNTPYPKAVEGDILDDANQNCVADNLEQSHRNAKILAFDNGLDTFYYATDSLSHYEAYLDTGSYTIHLLNNNPIWEGCPLVQNVIVDTSYLIQEVDFVMEPIQACPQLEVTVKPLGIDWFCQGQDMTISYVNTGTADAINSFVDVQLDSGMLLLNSALPILSQTLNTYRFSLDTITYGASGEFNIRVRPNCQFILGEHFFVEAHIYPDTLCDSLSQYIDLQQSCSLDTARFSISNYSSSALTTIPYWILENDIVVDTGTIQLGNGQTMSIKYPENSGATYPYYQLILYPYSMDYMASIPVSCRNGFRYRNPLFSPNYRRSSISTYYNSSGLAYDPNIKVANPEGYDSLHHYLFPNHPIDYTVHFQNTGTDTAEVVVILDTLSAHLNIGSLEMQGSSHSYTWRMLPYTPSGLHVLEITFDQIMLPDSNINEAASHGFIQYHIEQVADLPNFTRLENSASIYFDSNAPIKTNTAFHTICDSCFTMNITNNTVVVGAEKVDDALPDVRLYPNPSNQTLVLESSELIERVLVYNTLGQLVLQELNIQEKRLPISTALLENGTYFISLLINGEVVNQVFQVLH